MQTKMIDPCPCGDAHPDEANYYASIKDAGRTGLLAGPFKTHQEALAITKRAHQLASELNTWAWFFSYGTVAMKPEYTKPGVLNKELGLA